MATATSDHAARTARRPKMVAAAAALAAVAALTLATLTGMHGSATHRSGPFAWLRTAAAPAGWHTTTTPSGAKLAYPPDWHRIQSDDGSVSAAPATGGVFAGYLNVTPLSGAETLSNWSRFRPAHNVHEGARHEHVDAAVTGVSLRASSASCVIDSYATDRAHFREIACIVAGKHGTAVVVGAAPVQHWAAQAPVLERAVAAFTT